MDISQGSIHQVFLLNEKHLLLVITFDKIRLDSIKLYNIDDDNKEYFCIDSINYETDHWIYDGGHNVDWFKINDELFLNCCFKMIKINYDSANKPIKISIINNHIDDQINIRWIMFPRFILNDKKFLLIQHKDEFELCSILRNENNDIILEKKKLLNIPYGWKESECDCGECIMKIKRECPKIICASNNNNQIFLGNYKNIYSYDLTTFEQKKKLSFNKHKEEIERYFFIANQQKNEIYFFAQFDQSNIAIYIISLKCMELWSIFEFKDDFKTMLEPNKYHLLKKVYYLEHFQTFILNFGYNLLLIFKYDENHDIKLIKRIYFLIKDILEIQLINKNTNIIMLETTNKIAFKNKEVFRYKKFDNFEKFLENLDHFIEYSYDYYKSKLSEEEVEDEDEDEDEDEEEDDMEGYNIDHIDMKNYKDSKGKKRNKYKAKNYYNENKRTKVFVKKSILNKIKSQTKNK